MTNTKKACPSKLNKFIFFASISLLLTLFFYRAYSALTPFIISFVVAYLFIPLSFFFQEKCNLGKSLSAILIVLIVYTFLILVFTIGIPLLYNQAYSLIKLVPAISKFIEEKILPLSPVPVITIYKKIDSIIDVDTIFKTISDNKNLLLSRVYSSGVTVVGWITVILLVPVITFYLIRDWDAIYKSFLGLIPEDQKVELGQIINEIRAKVSAYIVGQAYAIAILSFLYGIGLTLVGLKFGFFIGILTAVSSIIPYIGFTISLITSILIALATGTSYLQLFGICGVLFAIQAIESNYIIPTFVGDKVGLHPLWIIFGLFIGGSIFGFIGLVLAIPITTIISVIIKHFIIKYKNSKYYEN